MHSTIKNSKYKTNGVKNNSDERNYDNSEKVHNSKGKDKKTFCIEIEMNESVRNLLSSSEKCHSALLDVTIMRPEPEEEIQTNTMKGTQVRKLLANLDRDHRDKKLLNELFEDKAPSEDTIVKISRHNPRKKMQAASDFCYDNNARERKFLKSQFHRTPKMRTNISSSAAVETVGRKHTNFNNFYSPGTYQVSPTLTETKADPQNVPSDDSFNYDVTPPIEKNFKCGDHKKTHHVYAASPRTFKDLNSIITCQSMSKDDRSPCLCEHCGIASLLSETQKRPIITAPVEHVSDIRRKMNRKEYKESSTKHDFRRKSEERNSFQAGLAHLYERIKGLEERMDIQEERAVPKDYFKRIITKIIAHFSPKPIHGSFQLRDSDSSTQVVEQPHRHNYKNNYSVNTLIIDKNDTNQKNLKVKSEHQENLKKLLSSLTEHMPENRKSEFTEDFWKWGGEILKPGVDLKNKILSLLDTAQKMRKEGDYRPKTEETKTRENTKRMKNSNSIQSLHDDNKEFDSEAFKSFVEAMSAKIYKLQKKHSSKNQMDENKSSSDNSLCKKTRIKGNSNQNKTAKRSMIPKMSRKEARSNGTSKNTNHDAGKKVDVSYMNPKLSSWQEEESQISFRLEFSDADTNTHSNKDAKNKDLEKLEFLRTLSRTKDSDKEKLWESIWAQAKANGQTKQDKVTIQLPRRNDPEFNDMIEIEFTIGEIEYMLTKHKYAVKNKMKS